MQRTLRSAFKSLRARFEIAATVLAWMRFALFVIALFIPWTSCFAEDFTLKAEKVEALEGGPVIVKLMLHYKGKEPKEVDWDSLHRPDVVSVTAPESWERKREPLVKLEGGGSQIIAGATVKAGDTFKLNIFLHHWFTKIPPGKATVKLTWSINPPLDLEDHNRVFPFAIAEPSTSIDLDVLPADAEHILALRKQVETILAKDKLDDEGREPRFLADKLRWTQHSDTCVPLCFRFLRAHSPELASVRADVLQYLYACSKESPDVRKTLVRHLAERGDSQDASFLFGCWGKKTLTRQETAVLMQSPNIYVKVMTLKYYRDHFGREIEYELLTELDRLKRMTEGDRE